MLISYDSIFTITHNGLSPYSTVVPRVKCSSSRQSSGVLLSNGPIRIEDKPSEDRKSVLHMFFKCVGLTLWNQAVKVQQGSMGTAGQAKHPRVPILGGQWDSM